MAVFTEIKGEYSALNHNVSGVITDKEPAFTVLKIPLRDKLAINLTHHSLRAF